MGNHTSRRIFPRKERFRRQSKIQSTEQIFVHQTFNQQHMDSHYILIDKILNDHFIYLPSDTDTQQLAMNIHRDALNLAMRNHMNAVYLTHPNYQQTINIV